MLVYFMFSSFKNPRTALVTCGIFVQCSVMCYTRTMSCNIELVHIVLSCGGLASRRPGVDDPSFDRVAI